MVNLIDQQIENPLTSRNKIIFFENCVLFFFFDIFVVISQGCAFLYLTGINDSISSLEVDATYWLITHHHFLWFLMQVCHRNGNIRMINEWVFLRIKKVEKYCGIKNQRKLFQLQSVAKIYLTEMQKINIFESYWIDN